MRLLDKIVKNIFNDKEEKSKETKEQYNACIVDIASFLDRDLTNLFERLYTTVNNANADIIVIINIYRKDLIGKIDIIANVFKKFSALIYLATSGTDVDVMKFTNKKAIYPGKVLVATKDFELIQSIASILKPEKVSFFLNKDDMPPQIHTISQIGYSVHQVDILNRKEGIIRRLIHISPSNIRAARNYKLPEEIETQIISVLPKEMEDLKKYIEENNLMDNLDNFKIALASMAIRGKIKFFHDKEKNIINVLQLKQLVADSIEQEQEYLETF